MTESVETNEPSAAKLRWRFPIAVCIIALIIHLVGKQMVDDDISMQSFVVVLTWLAAFVMIGVWWFFFSGILWRTRAFSALGFIALLAGFIGLFRFEGQGGNFIPQFSFRFQPSAEDRALEYFANAPTKDAPADSLDSANQQDASEDELAFPISDSDWPKFGGPNGDHIVSDEMIRTDWDSDPPQELWRHPIGPGWSSFAVVGDFLFSQEQRGEKECVVCYDANSGDQIWVHEDEERFTEPASGAGPRATPTVNDSRLYTLGATGVLNCLDPRSGEVLWRTNIVTDNGGNLIEWAASGSPVIHGDLVIVNPGTTKSFLAAYDRLTGEQKWNGPEAKAGYATPVVGAVGGEDQIVMYRAQGVGGYSLETGEELWFFEWVNATQINVAQPIILPDQSVFISTGYGGGSARLDVSRSGETWVVESRWERPNKFKLKFNGGIYKDGYVYGLDEGILSCFDLEEGERTWKKGRYSFGQILMVGEMLLVLTEKGDVVLVSADSESMEEQAKFPAIEGKTWNHPVLNRGRLFVRNDREVACFDVKQNVGPTE